MKRLKFIPILLLSLMATSCCELFDDCPDTEEVTGENAEEFNVLIQDVKTFANSPAIPANSNTIDVYFKLNDINGNPVPNRSETFFEIFEKSSSQSEFNIISVNEADRRIDPNRADFRYFNTIVLDLSGSVIASADGLNILKDATTNFVNSTYGDIGNENLFTSIIWFDGLDNINILQEFTNEQGLLLDQIESINADLPQDSSTNLNGAVVQSVNYLTSTLNSQPSSFILGGSILFFTDGRDQANRVSASLAQSAASNVANGSRPVNVYTIGLGSEIDETFLTTIGSSGAFFADNISDLQAEFQRVAQRIEDEANSYYLMRYCSPKRDGVNEVKIGVKGKASIGGIAGFNASSFVDNCLIE
ncbi:vWA domain-containing protein [Gilvibacter sediminis]|uniref:vWA domain-containing protein n=1 Tax=Gilvibacter sediminis TaxID=379071 RepID=UPI002350BBCB|nr:VWA domain-containing protein [Gilvibacter sediminis]MDC7999329.1 VWA domain-containing protein [Gilvibacter sediminis]